MNHFFRRLQMIITVGNTKGGVGKTTIAINLAVEAVIAGKTVLILDTDPQGSAISFRTERVASDIKVVSQINNTIHEDIDALSAAFDFVIIDAGGRDNEIFRSAVAACKLFLLPVLPSQVDIWAVDDAVKAFREIRPFNKMTGRIVLNQIQPNTNVSSEAKEALETYSQFLPVLEQKLHHRVAYKASFSFGQGVSEYEPHGKAAEEVHSLYSAVTSVI